MNILSKNNKDILDTVVNRKWYIINSNKTTLILMQVDYSKSPSNPVARTLFPGGRCIQISGVSFTSFSYSKRISRYLDVAVFILKSIEFQFDAGVLY